MRTSTLIQTLLTLSAASCGGGPVDTSEGIAMLTDEDASEEVKEEIRRAGDAWNSEFGIQLSFGKGNDRGGSIEIRLTRDGCMNERFQKTLGQSNIDPPEVRVCPEILSDLHLFFETVRHELGHVLGIRRHTRSMTAVMAALSTEPRHWFQEEDRTLFFSANPDL